MSEAYDKIKSTVEMLKPNTATSKTTVRRLLEVCCCMAVIVLIVNAAILWLGYSYMFGISGNSNPQSSPINIDKS
jgi:hypothetical protein